MTRNPATIAFCSAGRKPATASADTSPHALAASYALLSRDNWSPIPLGEILKQELQPFLSGEHVNAALTGPMVLVEPRMALALGLAVHELTTNAVKFGALSRPDGKVDINWTVEKTAGDDELVLKWVEQNGPPVAKPARRGFGMTLIERVFSNDVEGEAKVNFLPEGVVATLRGPLPAKQRRATVVDETNRVPSRDEQDKATP